MNQIYDPIERSQKLTIFIRELISEQGSISFAHYMELALYHPTLGYYNAFEFTLDKNGDYTTASEISPLYAKCFAEQCAEIFSSNLSQNILEIGAGTGHFARDLLTALMNLGYTQTRYLIYEISATLRKKQQAYLREYFPMFYARVTWLEQLPENFNGIIIANEILDALPIHCFKIENKIANEKRVIWKNDHFIWKTAAPNELLAKELNALAELYQLEDGYESEINLTLEKFIRSLSACLKNGVILFADYGYGQREYYHPQRTRGTLTCFYQHTKSENPFLLPGLQDITAHVDFTRVIEYATDLGLDLAGFTTQSAFLLSCGLTELATHEEKKLNDRDAIQLHQAIKLLTMPMEMGECVKVMALAKNFEKDLLGFRFQNRIREL